PDRVPSEHRIARLRSVHPGRYCDAELLREPRHRSVTTQRYAVVLARIRVKSGGEPTRSTARGTPRSLDLIRCNPDLDRTLSYRALQSRSAGPVHREERSVVICSGSVDKPVVLHPCHDLVEVGALEDSVSRRPSNDVSVRDEYLGVVASLGERFF